MKKVLLAVALAATVSARPALASNETLMSSKDPSYVGEAVTFTASFSYACSDGASDGFVVDRAAVPATTVNDTATSRVIRATVTFRSAGDHPVSFWWDGSPQPDCKGGLSVTQHVIARPAAAQPSPARRSPVPSQAPSPAPSASPTPTPSPATVATSPRLTGHTSPASGPPVGALAVAVGALLVILLVARGISRRRS